MTEYVRVLCDRIGTPTEYPHPPVPTFKAQVLCDNKVLYATDHPPILVDQKANLLKITESQMLNWISNIQSSHILNWTLELIRIWFNTIYVSKDSISITSVTQKRRRMLHNAETSNLKPA